jgi:cytoskeletal protein RodZ
MSENLFGVVTILVIIFIAGLWGWKRQRELYQKFEEGEEDTLESEEILNVEVEKDETVSETEETTKSEETTEETKKYTPKRRTRKPYKKSNKHKKD